MDPSTVVITKYVNVLGKHSSLVSVAWIISQSINQSNQSTNQPTNQPINQSINQSIKTLESKWIFLASDATSVTSTYHWVRSQTPAHLPNNFEVKEFFSLFFLMANKVGWCDMSQTRTDLQHPKKENRKFKSRCQLVLKLWLWIHYCSYQ